jgi:hypothetical protein
MVHHTKKSYINYLFKHCTIFRPIRYLIYRDMPSSEKLRNAECNFRTDISGQPIGPIFKDQPVQESRIQYTI